MVIATPTTSELKEFNEIHGGVPEDESLCFDYVGTEEDAQRQLDDLLSLSNA